MDELREKFPDLAASVQAMGEAPVSDKPAAVLHSAQSACQVAFKQLQAAEEETAELEVECNELVADLREKVEKLQKVQASLVQIRLKYDETARNAQLEVQRTRHAGSGTLEAEHVHKLVQEFGPDQLEAMAKNLSEAATAARAKSAQPQPSEKKGSTEEEAQASSQNVLPAQPEHGQTMPAPSVDATMEQAHLPDAPPPAADGTAPAAQSVPPGDAAQMPPLLSVTPSSAGLPHEGGVPAVEESRSSVSPVRASSRGGSRSPRRTGSATPPAPVWTGAIDHGGRTVSPEGQTKVARHGQDDSPSRARSSSQAHSQKSGHSVEHSIADDMQAAIEKAANASNLQPAP